MARLPILATLVVIAACVFAPLSAWSQGGAPQGGPPMTRGEHMAKLKAEREQRFADARARSEAIRAEQRRVDAEQDAMAQKASDEANARWAEMRARNAEQIKKFDDTIEDWREDNPSPPGAVEEFVSSSYDEETALGESARIVFYNRQDVPTHQIDFGADGKPTGPITVTQQGKAWETIGPQLVDGAKWEPTYGRSPEGDVIIVSADIIKNGRVDTRFFFNGEGVPWKGQRWSYEGVPPGKPGIVRGGFYDPRLEPPPDTLGAGFDVPASPRLITGVCPECREKADRYNELASRASNLLGQMRQQSEEHKHHHRAAQIPIEQRYAHLKAELDALTPELEAARAAALECEKMCRPQSKLQAPDLTRPSLLPVAKLEPPASFCDEFARVAYMNEVYTPAAKASLVNAQTASAHLGKLGGMFTDYMKNEGGSGWAAVRAEQTAYGPIAQTATDDSNAINAMYQRILAIPIVPCPDQKPRVATGDPAPPPLAPATEDVGVIPARMVEQARVGKKPCPPKGRRQPIVVGPNSKVGSGAQLTKKLGGMLVGGLLGAAGVGGGGGGGGGPQLYTCKIKDSEMTLFTHPSGLALRVGAKRGKGDTVNIFADIAKSPDKGTFQAALLETPDGGKVQSPSDAGPCDLWGDWQLTVSWTKTTYVNGQMVSQESGGWSEGGKFSLPGMLTKSGPQPMWASMGFSSASHGAKEAFMKFSVPQGGGPLTFVTYITQPKGDPVMAVPFVMTMTETSPGVFTFTEGEADCPEPLGPTTVSTPQPPPAGGTRTRVFDDGAEKQPILPDMYWSFVDSEVFDLRSMIDAGDKDPCSDGYDRAIRQIRRLRQAIAAVLAEGKPITDGGRDQIAETETRLNQIEAELKEKMAARKPCPSTGGPTSVATTDNPDSILDEIDQRNPEFLPPDPLPVTPDKAVAPATPPTSPGPATVARAPDTTQYAPDNAAYDQPGRRLAVQDIVDDWVADDLILIDQMTKDGVCQPGLREALINQINARRAYSDRFALGETTDKDDAISLDAARSKALLDWLGGDPEACRPPGAPPRQPTPGLPPPTNPASPPVTPPEDETAPVM